MKIVAVTSCPTGIAHTYMAAEALENAGTEAGHELVVETQGAGGVVELDPAVIAAADAVVFAADVEVRNRARFDGKPLVVVGVKRAINDAAAVVREAVEAAERGDVPAASGAGASGGGLATKVDTSGSRASQVRGWLMTGVSYMIPFVAAGGILIALSFMIGGYEIVEVDAAALIDSFDVLSAQSWAGLLFVTGAAAFAFLVPVLAGFIAFAIADRPGLVPGFVGGALAVAVGAGFLGGLVAGVFAGFVALYISRLDVPAAVRAIMPVVVTPLVATALTGVLMLVVVGAPLASLSDGLSSWLNGLAGANAILLGGLLGLMMAFDMGGPVNKVAYAFATTGLAAAAASQSGTPLVIMAAVMAAGMTPPLGMALATAVRKHHFTHAERENGKAAWVLGASFITEGAIPFAAADPLRVIPAAMVGSAVTGGMVMGFESTLRAPHGGIWVTPLIGGAPLYLLAVAVGTVVTAVVVVGLKSLRREPVAATSAVDLTDTEPARASVPA